MRSSFTKILAIAVAVACLLLLVGCASDTTTYYYDEATGTWTDSASNVSGGGGNTNSGNNGGGSSNVPSIEVGKIDWTIRYVDSDGMAIPVTGTELSIDKNYTLELRFSITANSDNDGTQMIDTVLSFADINILNGSIKEAETGKQTVQTPIDSETGVTRKDITLSFKVPDQKDVQKEIIILVGLDPVDTTDSSQMTVAFASEDAKITGNGSDGILRSFSISAVSLNAPAIILNNYTLMWNHVANATYYQLVVDGKLTNITIDASEYDAGSLIQYNLMEHMGDTDANGNPIIPSIARIQLIACNEDNNFKNSPYSNEVTGNF